jgi:hypothetical protein
MILQDELHLIEGPLGSLVGFYETAIDTLCQERATAPPKYIASTATTRRAEDQVKAVFLRDLQVFPPLGLDIDDRFFVSEHEAKAQNDSEPGRLYLGICAPGRGPLTPVVRIWSELLEKAWILRNNPKVDGFWTLTGYFNAIRELGGARALYRQDIPQRINNMSSDPRPLEDQRGEQSGVELSGRTSSTDLPSVLDMLSHQAPNSPDAFFTTSMFGTGIDIRRIRLMVVNGQPKTTSDYIQSTGRVGRSSGALVVTFLRASRPRDLSHYEFFCGYHRQLHRFVEPVTVYPFAPGVLERAAGPLLVLILRNKLTTTVPWNRPNTAPLMSNQRTKAQEVLSLPNIIEKRAQGQPAIRRPSSGSVEKLMKSKLDDWWSFASNIPDLRYGEYVFAGRPEHSVVLGDARHQHENRKNASVDVVYKNALQSLRDMEETTGFQT